MQKKVIILRVIAGTARRTLLVAPKGHDTRPTSDRVKENVFNIIAPGLRDAYFLDLFCGSGAIGIEALSRGASMAVFADIATDAVKATKDNLTQVRFTGKAKVLNMCAIEAIANLKNNSKLFDIIYLDPPYGSGLLDKALLELTKHELLAPDGVIIAEYATDEPPQDHAQLYMYDQRKYGNTQVSFYWHPKGMAQ